MRPGRPAEATCPMGGLRACQIDGQARAVANGIIAAQACYGSRKRRQDGRQAAESRARGKAGRSQCGLAVRNHPGFADFFGLFCLLVRSSERC